jgi:hypothetical protein
MTPSLRQRAICKAAASAIIAALSMQNTVLAADEPFETPSPRPAAEVLPQFLLRGPHFEVAPVVESFAYMNRYVVKSDVGTFAVTGNARLRRCVREIDAIVALRKVRTSDAFVQAAGGAAMGSVRAVKSLIEEPVDTVSALPEGVLSIFNRASEQLDRGGRSEYEDGAAKSLLSVSSYKRDYARQLGVDVYSSNEVLQKDLNSVAWTAAAGNLSVGLVSAATGSAALDVASKVRWLDQAKSIIDAKTPQELSLQNRKTLGGLQVPSDAVDAFLANRMLSPRHQTLIVSALQSLGGVTGTAAFIRYATQAENEDSALYIQQQAELLAGYSAKVSPVRSIAILVNMVAAQDRAGNEVIVIPVDHVVWSQRTAEIAARLAKGASTSSTPKQTSIWITGDATPRAREGLAGLKLTLVENAGTRVPLLD